MPGCARVGDQGVKHCSGFTIAAGSGDVFINGLGAARVGDSSSTHLKPGGRRCVPHTATIAAGSPNVFVNGLPIARVGDALADCTSIAAGSPDVSAN